jgi:hypothetical protein
MVSKYSTCWHAVMFCFPTQCVYTFRISITVTHPAYLNEHDRFRTSENQTVKWGGKNEVPDNISMDFLIQKQNTIGVLLLHE